MALSLNGLYMLASCTPYSRLRARKLKFEITPGLRLSFLNTLLLEVVRNLKTIHVLRPLVTSSSPPSMPRIRSQWDWLCSWDPPLFSSRVLGAFHFPTTVSLPLRRKVQYGVDEGVNCLQCNMSYESLSPACVMKVPPRLHRRRLLPKTELAWSKTIKLQLSYSFGWYAR